MGNHCTKKLTQALAYRQKAHLVHHGHDNVVIYEQGSKELPYAFCQDMTVLGMPTEQNTLGYGSALVVAHIEPELGDNAQYDSIKITLSTFQPNITRATEFQDTLAIVRDSQRSGYEDILTRVIDLTKCDSRELLMYLSGNSPQQPFKRKLVAGYPVSYGNRLYQTGLVAHLHYDRRSDVELAEDAANMLRSPLLQLLTDEREQAKEEEIPGLRFPFIAPTDIGDTVDEERELHAFTTLAAMNAVLFQAIEHNPEGLIGKLK